MSETAGDAANSALHAIVEGRVQGVNFRMFVQTHAARLRINGWVRNLSDGSVEVWAEGSRATLDQLLSLLHEGPPAALVTSVHARWETASRRYNRFSVLATA